MPLPATAVLTLPTRGLLAALTVLVLLSGCGSPESRGGGQPGAAVPGGSDDLLFLEVKNGVGRVLDASYARPDREELVRVGALLRDPENPVPSIPRAETVEHLRREFQEKESVSLAALPGVEFFRTPINWTLTFPTATGSILPKAALTEPRAIYLGDHAVSFHRPILEFPTAEGVYTYSWEWGKDTVRLNQTTYVYEVVEAGQRARLYRVRPRCGWTLGHLNGNLLGRQIRPTSATRASLNSRVDLSTGPCRSFPSWPSRTARDCSSCPEAVLQA